MNVREHIIASVPAGVAVYTITSNPGFAIIAALSSVLIDVDHMIDQVIERRGPVSLGTMMKTYREQGFSLAMQMFHSWEFIAALAMAGYYFSNIILSAMALGFAFHLVCDTLCWGYLRPRIKPVFYFFLYRLVNRFSAERLILR